MDRLIVERKLDSLRRCPARIETKRPSSLALLEKDIDLQDVLVLNISRAVQVCVDLASHLLADLDLPPPNTMGEAFDRLAEAGIINTDLALQMKKQLVFATLPCMPMMSSTGKSSSLSPRKACTISNILRKSSPPIRRGSPSATRLIPF